MTASRPRLWRSEEMPAGWAWSVRARRTAPTVAVLSLLAIVLRTIEALAVSWSEMPAPDQPATLFTIMLLVIVTRYQLLRWFGLSSTSLPLTSCVRMPPPCPVAAWLPWIEVGVDGDVAGAERERRAAGGSPAIRMPPPERFRPWLNDWLNRIWLNSIRPGLLRPRCPIPPPSPRLKLPQMKLRETV